MKHIKIFLIGLAAFILMFGFLAVVAVYFKTVVALGVVIIAVCATIAAIYFLGELVISMFS